MRGKIWSNAGAISGLKNKSLLKFIDSQIGNVNECWLWYLNYNFQSFL